MDIGKSFSYPFEDNQWLSKLGLGTVISMVPILNFAMTGYMIEIVRNLMRGVQQPLPNWDDFGRKFMDGLMLVLVGLVYALPILLLSCLPLSFMAVPAILSSNGDMQYVAEALAGVGGVLLAGMACLFVVYGLVLSVIFPAVYILYAREGTFASCFKLREVFDIIGKNGGPFFTAWGISLLAGLGVGLAAGIVSSILGLIPCIGWIASIVITLGVGVYISVIYAHLFGQFGQIAYQEKPLLPSDQPTVG
ncbi:MAG TPA: DUF4013 domain-containing protein [Anaerolineales bacterium]|nr:DUF4013 domain-containing protein [Anaerolineales bacterium]